MASYAELRDVAQGISAAFAATADQLAVATPLAPHERATDVAYEALVAGRVRGPAARVFVIALAGAIAAQEGGTPRALLDGLWKGAPTDDEWRRRAGAR